MTDASSPFSKETIAAVLTALPGWEQFTAYEMSKRCCEEYLKRESPLPSWTTIRTIIGKGSAQDINRAKNDFLQEQLSAARRLKISGESLPAVLTPFFHQLWSAAVEEVEKNISYQTAELQSQLQIAQDTAKQAESEKELVIQKFNEVQTELTLLKERFAQLNILFQSERLAREQAESLLNLNTQELANQKEALQKALNGANSELKKSLDRLEAMENRSLLEIEKVKSESLTKQEREKDKTRKLHAELTIEMAKAEKKYEDLSLSYKNNLDKLLKLDQENAFLKEKNSILQTHIAQLSSTNNQLTETLKKISEKNKNRSNKSSNIS